MDAINLYNQTDKKIMCIAEDARLPGKNRIEEIKKFAELSGVKRIGIANCVSFQKETNKLKEILSDQFEIFSIDCKNEKIPTSLILDRQDAKGISCNPAGQAAFLAKHQTELNISFGLCMGHDIIFNQKSESPVTTLLVKDREFKHNPLMSLTE